MRFRYVQNAYDFILNFSTLVNKLDCDYLNHTYILCPLYFEVFEVLKKFELSIPETEYNIYKKHCGYILYMCVHTFIILIMVWYF